MNITINFTRLCEEAKIITGTREMTLMLLLQCIFGIVALFPNIVTIILLFRVKVFHLNLRVLLAHLSFDLTIYSATIAEKALRRLLTPPCSLSMSFKGCIREDWPISLPLHNAMMALVILLLERLYSTIWFRTYDKSSRRPYLAISLLIVSWISTFSILITNYLDTAQGVWVAVCETSFVLSQRQIKALTISFILLEIVAVGLMIFVYTYNRFTLRRMVMNRAQFDLSARFQVDQNVNVNAALLPSAILHVIFHLPTYSSILSAFIDLSKVNVETKAWFMHLTFVWRLVYAFMHPSLLIFLNPNLREGFYKTAFGKNFEKARRKTSAIDAARLTSGNVANTHFEYLQKMWDTPASYKRSKRIYSSPTRIEINENRKKPNLMCV